MKKLILLSFAALSFVACNKETSSNSGFKTAYVDTAKLLDENTEAKDIEEKWKVKSEEMGRELRTEAAAFEQEARGFQANAQVKGPEWAQKKGAELQQREQQLNVKQQTMMQTLQQESGKEMDSLVTRLKDYIKTYGKKQGYDYIYGTGDAATVLYAKEGFDITAKIIEEVNANYKGKGASTDAKKEVSKEDSTATK
ncbi:MAG: OmpH family outer membrane protein [Flavobacterium sp.]|nr:OmpH family outer membrane protein [Candidatus Neoflavobacterium equi]